MNGYRNLTDIHVQKVMAKAEIVAPTVATVDRAPVTRGFKLIAEA